MRLRSCRVLKGCIAAGSLLGVGALTPLPASAQASAYEQLQAFSGVLNQVRLNYVDSVDYGRLVEAAIRGMLGSLDPHSRYVTRREFELQARWDRGELAGPGLNLEASEHHVTVLSVWPKGPAFKAGVQAGDRILRINDSVISVNDPEAVELRLLGEPGTKVRLVLERGKALAPDTLAVTLQRTTLEHPVVTKPRLLGRDIGYVQLFEFTPVAPQELQKAFDKARKMGARRMILDLRGNPGGDMTAMVEIASSLLPGGTTVFHTVGRTQRESDSVFTFRDGRFAKLPLILLIDQESASAAEILAGSLQDHDRALLVGRRSFGKALVQSSLPLPNGDVVWLTTARLSTPSGRIIQRQYPTLTSQHSNDTLRVYRTRQGRPVRSGNGVLPDVVLPDPVELPVWFSVAVDSGYDAVADSVGHQLPDDQTARSAWVRDSVAWDTRLLAPFLERVRAGLGIRVAPSPALRLRISRMLAARAAVARWGEEAGEDLLVETDRDIKAALTYFPRLPELLKAPTGRQLK